MFDVSWTDPTRETVGQRKHRKDRTSTRGSSPSIHSSKSSDSSKSIKHSIFGFFGGGNKKEKVSAPVPVTSPKSPAFKTEQSSKVSRRMSSYTSTSETSTSTQEVRETTTTTITRIPVNGFFSTVPSYSESERSPSDGRFYCTAVDFRLILSRIHLFWLYWKISRHQVIMELHGRWAKQESFHSASEPEFLCHSKYRDHCRPK